MYTNCKDCNESRYVHNRVLCARCHIKTEKAASERQEGEGEYRPLECDINYQRMMK